MNKDIRRMTHKRIRRSMLTMFIISLILPIMTLLFYYGFSYQYNPIKYLFGGETQVESLKSGEYSYTEKAGRVISNIIIDNPELISDEDGFVAEVLPYVVTENNKELTIIARREDKIIVYDALRGEYMTDEELEYIVSNLPEFNSGPESKERLYGETNTHMNVGQKDFYFENGDRGTVFSFFKFDNIFKKIARNIAKNVATVFFGTLLIYSLYVYRVSRSIIDPVRNMLQGMGEIEKKNYKYRIDGTKVKNEMIVMIDSFNSMSEELSKTEEKNEQLEQMRKDFIDTVSHDLKTPITSIKIHVEAIRDGVVNSPEKMESYLANILKKTDDMQSMIDELTVYADFENGKSIYRKQDVDFRAFIQDLVDEFSYDIEKVAGKINFTYEKESDYKLNIDLEKMKRAVFNIFENALKYAQVDQVIINVELKENESHEVILSIKDNGVGVKPENMRAIFKKFYREDEARNQNTAGSGIGLAITKSIIEGNNGTIEGNIDNTNGLELIISLKK